MNQTINKRLSNSLKLLFLLSCVLFSASKLHSQVLKESKARIDNIDFELDSNIVKINYELISSRSEERFDILVSIYKSSSNEKVNAKTFSGDIFNQAPGKSKIIKWNISEDISYLDDNIYIELQALQTNPITIPYTSKKVAALQSTAFPGWGTAKITMNKIHFLKGVAAYSLLALSVKSNYDAADYYEKYKVEESDGELRLKYFNDAEISYQNSFYYFGGAASIWLIEYLWIYLSPNKTDSNFHKEKKLSFGYSYNPYAQTPILTFNYKF